MAEKDEVFELIRSVIMSKKGGVLLRDLNGDYKSLAGQHIPYAKLGYKCIEDLLSDISEIKQSVNQNGHILYTSTGKNCEHLVELIEKQKSTKAKHKTKIHHSKKEEIGSAPKCNAYLYKNHSKAKEHKNSKTKSNNDSHEAGHEERTRKESRSKYDQPTHIDSKHKENWNYRGRSGLDLDEPSRYEEQEMYALNQRQRWYRYQRINDAQYFNDSCRYEEENPLPVFRTRQDFRNYRMNQAPNFNESFRYEEVHPHQACRTRRDYMNFEMNRYPDIYELSRYEEEILIAKQDYSNSRINHLPDLREPFYEEYTNNRTSGRNFDKSVEAYPKSQDPQNFRSRYIPEINELASNDRELLYNQRRYNTYHHENERNYNWENGDNEYCKWMKEYQRSRSTDRKINLVNGSLLVTIKNY